MIDRGYQFISIASDAAFMVQAATAAAQTVRGKVPSKLAATY